MPGLKTPKFVMRETPLYIRREGSSLWVVGSFEVSFLLSH
jgi:hypothetical protein